jgi:VCBS repeat-containing protein
MAIKNIKVYVAPPATNALSPKVVFVSSATADDYIRIPRRVPFADVVAPAGTFRHNIVQNAASGTASTTVATNAAGDVFNGSATTNTEGGLGYQLPHIEKLVLLVKKGTTTAEVFTIEGSLQYRIPDLAISVPAGASGDIYEFSLANFGLYIGGVDGEDGIMIKNATTTLGLALIARAA